MDSKLQRKVKRGKRNIRRYKMKEYGIIKISPLYYPIQRAIFKKLWW